MAPDDPVGRVLAETCNGQTVASTYDLAGQRISPAGCPESLDSAGHILYFGHDLADRETGGAILRPQWPP